MNKMVGALCATWITTRADCPLAEQLNSNHASLSAVKKYRWVRKTHSQSPGKISSLRFWRPRL